MYYFIILLSILFLTGGGQPDTTIPVLSVTAEGSVELPADIILFNVNLNAEESTPESAYQVHKSREEALVKLLDRYEIKEADINFRPVSISKSRQHIRPGQQEITYQTHQLVQLTIRDFENYEKIQLALIRHGFDNFSGHFMTSEEEEGKEQALRKAIQIAKEKARVIAEEAGVDLGEISKIHYSSQDFHPVERQSLSAMQDMSGQLMKYDQTVVLTASIRIDFEIVGE